MINVEQETPTFQKSMWAIGGIYFKRFRKRGPQDIENTLHKSMT